MSPLIRSLTVSLLVVLCASAVVWVVSVFRRDASIADTFWGSGFVLVALFTLATTLGARDDARSWTLAVLTTLWGVRLTAHLGRRNLRHGEDRRYRAMRDHYGPSFWWISLGIVFLLQAAILWFVSLPVQVPMLLAPRLPLGWLDALGLAVFGVGFFFEAVADWQMELFQADPGNAGKVMDRGLWRLSRHPSYFGDFCLWWGLYLIAAAGGAGWTILSPMLLTFLLLRVSGVTLLEKTIASRRPGYAAYQARTNSFFPWPPRTPTVASLAATSTTSPPESPRS